MKRAIIYQSLGLAAAAEEGGALRPRIPWYRDDGRPRPPCVLDITCDLDGGETPCHDEPGCVVGCAPPGEGCPCMPFEERCDSSRFGSYCDVACCDWQTQERCHGPAPDDGSGVKYEVWCADRAAGGCGCPDGEVSCGASDVSGGSMAHCTSLCCPEGTQTCYDANYDPSYCADIAAGGCPCDDGLVKCGNTTDWAGYCTEVCCDVDEEACYDIGGGKRCEKFDRGGCSAETSPGYWMSRATSVILGSGSGGQVAYFAAIRERRDELAGQETPSADLGALVKQLEEEEAALFHAIRVRVKERELAWEEVASVA